MNSAPKIILDDLLLRYPQLQIVAGEIQAAFELCRVCVVNDGTILICGNGGSSSDADHIVGELVKGFRLNRPLDKKRCERLTQALPPEMESIPRKLQKGIRAISLSAHSVLLTAIANDVTDELVFAQQVSVYGRKGDVVLGISTSGNARNVAVALAIGHAYGLKTISLSGKGGGLLNSIADIAINVPTNETYLVQELHLPIYHALCAMLEADLFGT